MKNSQFADFEAFKRVSLLNSSADNATLIQAMPEYTPVETRFNAAFLKIQAGMQAQAVDTSGIAQDVDILKLAMAEIIEQYGFRASVVALTAGNHELAKEVGHTYSYYYYAPKELAISRATDTKQVLKDNPNGIFTNILPADITAMETAIKNYTDEEVKPIEAIHTKKALGTDILPEQFKIANECLTQMYMLWHSYYDKTIPEKVDAFRLAMTSINTGTRHTGLIAFVVYNNPAVDSTTNAIENVQVKITELNIIAHSDINGLAGLARFRPGTYHVEFSGTGLVTKTLILTFKRGKMLELEVDMEKTV